MFNSEPVSRALSEAEDVEMDVSNHAEVTNKTGEKGPGANTGGEGESEAPDASSDGAQQGEEDEGTDEFEEEIDVDVSAPASEDDGNEEIEEEGEEEGEPSPPPALPKFKLTLKLPPRSVSASTPGESRGASGSGELDIESEDDPAEEEEYGEEGEAFEYGDVDEDVDMNDAPMNRSSKSKLKQSKGRMRVSATTPTASALTQTRSMTTRQAVLASVVDSTHVSLSETSKKKKTLNDAELALRREETARKRKNLSEKKLQDEKAETINRLLKKQTKPRNKRNALATADDASGSATPLLGTATVPTTATSKPRRSAATRAEENEDGGKIGQGEFDEVPTVVSKVPEMYRWVSSVKTGMDGGKEKVGVVNYSIPVCAMGDYETASSHWTEAEGGAGAREESMEVDEAGQGSRAKPKPVCDVLDCSLPRKYRLVKDWKKGACGMGHLKALEGSLVV